MTYHKLYNVLRQLSAILSRALKSNTQPWLRVVHVGISVTFNVIILISVKSCRVLKNINKTR